MMFCPYCGADNPEGSAFCVWCGSPIDTEAQTSAHSVPKKKGGKAGLVICAALLSVVILTAIWLLWGRDHFLGPDHPEPAQEQITDEPATQATAASADPAPAPPAGTKPTAPAQTQPTVPAETEPVSALPRPDFNNTCWDLCVGRGMGGHYALKFSTDGTFLSRHLGSRSWGSGTFTYENETLSILLYEDGYLYQDRVFHWDGEQFVGEDQMAGADYPCTVTAQPDWDYRFSEDETPEEEYTGGDDQGPLLEGDNIRCSISDGDYLVTFCRDDVEQVFGLALATAKLLSLYTYQDTDMSYLKVGGFFDASHYRPILALDRSEDHVSMVVQFDDGSTSTIELVKNEDGVWVEIYPSGIPVTYLLDREVVDLFFAEDCVYLDQYGAVLNGRSEPDQRKYLTDLFDYGDEIRELDIQIRNGFVTRAFLYYRP